MPDDLVLKPEAALHMLEDIDHLAESGNVLAELFRSFIKKGWVEVFDAYAALYEMGLVDPDEWEVADGD